MKRRILFVNGNLNVGGVEKALVNVLRHLDKETYEIDLLLFQSGDDYLNEIPNHVRVIRQDLTAAYGPFIKSVLGNIRKGDVFCLVLRLCLIFSRKLGNKVLKWLSPLLKVDCDYDVAVAFRPGICADMVAYAVRAEKKMCWWHHGNLKIGISERQLAATWRHFDRIVAVSDGVARLLAETFQSLCEKIVVIPNMVDIPFIKQQAACENPFTKEDGYTYIVTVSRLSEEKSVDLVIPVAKALKAHGYRFKWHIVGDGDMLRLINRMITDNELNNDIVTVGNQPNPYSWIKNSDLMVHTSSVESFGLVLIEAMALGTPCLAVQSVGACELINGDNGRLVSSRVPDIVEGIERIINSKLGSGMIAPGIETATRYSSQRIIKKIENEFN